MAKILVVFIVAMVALQGALAKPKAKAAAPEKSQFEELAEKTQILVNNVTKTLGIDELPDTKKVTEIFTTNAQNLATKVNEFVEKLKTEVTAHQPEVDSVIDSVQKKLSETATTLQNAAGPEAKAKAQEIKAKLDEGLKEAVEQIEKLSKAVLPDATKTRADLESGAKTLLDGITDITNNLKTEFEKTMTQHEQTHKH